MLANLFERWCLWMQARGSCKITYLNSGGRTGPAVKYMERYYLLRLFGWALFLHCFHSSDPEGVHDHPWDWFSFILAGWYHEEGADGSVRGRGFWSLKLGQAEVFHRIHIDPLMRGRVWTLFGHGQRRRVWGYLEPGQPWRADPKNFGREQYVGHIFPRLVERSAS